MGSITDVPGIRVGCWQNEQAMTGCTVIWADGGAVGGVDVRGGAPGTRETDLLSPLNTVEKVNAVLLSGGSAFGLDAAGGVMRFLEERSQGHPVGKVVVPIVPAAVIFDLGLGDSRVRPGSSEGYSACEQSGSEVQEGNYGAGCGASVGKLRGYQHATKSGQGTYAIALPGGVVVGVLAVVNAFGDVYDLYDRKKIIAGVRDDQGEIIGTLKAYGQMVTDANPTLGANTTIAVVATNARLTKAQCTKLAGVAHNGLSRVIYPLHTGFDGDTIFALSTGGETGDPTIIGIAAQEALARAVLRAVNAAKSLGGIRAYTD